MRPDVVARDTRNWLERAVVGLNLCPFARAVHGKGQVHYAVSNASDPGRLIRLRRLGPEAWAALDVGPST
jgi:hypothetical protein